MSMTDETRQAAHDEAHRAFLQDTLRSVRHIMVENYNLTKVSIHPISEGASRLSNPIKIMGLNEHGEKVRYFGKVIGSKDIFTLRYIQFLKNISLQMNAHEPIFEIYETAEDMVRDQYKMMSVIYKSGIPAIKPYGYYSISGSQWLLVVEYLDAIPFALLPGHRLTRRDCRFYPAWRVTMKSRQGKSNTPCASLPSTLPVTSGLPAIRRQARKTGSRPWGRVSA